MNYFQRLFFLCLIITAPGYVFTLFSGENPPRSVRFSDSLQEDVIATQPDDSQNEDEDADPQVPPQNESVIAPDKQMTRPGR